MIILGAGSGGLVTSYIGALLKAKVALVEAHKMGGDCLNTGCVPSKALIQSCKVLYQSKNAAKYGLTDTDIQFDFQKIMSRIQSVISKIEPHDSIERYTSLGVDCLTGYGQILSPYEVKVNDQVLTTKNIVVATGAKPLVVPFKGLDQVPYLTSDNLWELKELPKRFVVLGGGPIGCEMAQCFARLGSKVSIIERGSNILAGEDPEVAQIIEAQLRAEGVEVLTGHSADSFEKGPKLITKKADGTIVEVEFDQCLMALGRRPNTKGFGLEELEVEFNKNGTIKVDPYLRTTKYKNIFACGDVAGPFQFTHTAAHQAWFCATNSLFQPLKKFKAEYKVVPKVTFTDPEVASVGLTESEAKAQNIPVEVTTYGIDDLDRAIADGADHGLVRVLTAPGKDTILGATIVASKAGDMLLEFSSAMKHGFGLNKIMSTIHPYPTMGEANKFAAGQWKMKNKPDWVFPWLEKFNTWKRK